MRDFRMKEFVSHNTVKSARIYTKWQYTKKLLYTDRPGGLSWIIYTQLQEPKLQVIENTERWNYAFTQAKQQGEVTPR